MALTLKQRQEQLDKEKWLISEMSGYDRSGCMDWCMYCKNQQSIQKETNRPTFWKCDTPQVDRESQCLCARAYNKMQKANKKA